MIIIGTDTPEYQVKRNLERVGGRFNGAYYYAKEIEKYFVPKIATERDWVLLNMKGFCSDRAIVFIHNNLYPEYYDWLSDYKDLILVCGVPETCEKVGHLGKAIYLPLSVDVKEVEQYRTEKMYGKAFVGRSQKRKGNYIPQGVRKLEDMERPFLLREMAKFREIYAIGRTAIEGKVLGCKILPYDKRFPDPEFWKVIDSMEAVGMLQKMIDEIDSNSIIANRERMW